MAVVANFTVDVTSGTVPFVAKFTDLSTGGPDRWLWDFGDGLLSTEQHPTYVYRRAGNWTVSLTAWKSAGDIAFENITPNIGLSGGGGLLANDALVFLTQEIAQNQFNQLDFVDWTLTGSANPTLHYLASGGPFGNEWRVIAACQDKFERFTGSEDTETRWLGTEFEWIVNSVEPSIQVDPFLRYSKKDFPGRGMVKGDFFKWKVGRWLPDTPVTGHQPTDAINTNGVGEYDGQQTDLFYYQLADKALVKQPIYNLEPYLSESGWMRFRIMDFFDYKNDLLNNIDFPPVSFSQGYDFVLFNGLWSQGGTNLPGDKDIKTEENLINALSRNMDLLSFPPILSSGIREGYFSDGWDIKKNVYVKQDKPFPSVIQFIDAYVETSNDK
jgi:hypothetical protein